MVISIKTPKTWQCLNQDLGGVKVIAENWWKVELGLSNQAIFNRKLRSDKPQTLLTADKQDETLNDFREIADNLTDI